MNGAITLGAEAVAAVAVLRGFVPKLSTGAGPTGTAGAAGATGNAYAGGGVPAARSNE